MTPIDRFERHLPDRLTELANPQVPDYFDDLLAQTRRSRQRHAWTFIERWLPVALLTQSGARVRPMRQAWQLLVVLAVTLALVAGLAVAGARLLLPPSPDQGFNSLVTVPTLELTQAWDSSSIDGLSHPSFMDIGPDGNLYVVNAGNSEILVIDPAGSIVRRWGTRGTGEGQFDFLVDAADPNSASGGVAVGADGSVYVTDPVNDRIQQFDASAAFVRQWGGFGPSNGQFLHPFDLAVGPGGNVFVVDDRRDDIQEFAPDGTWLSTLGTHGTADGQLSNTGGVDIDAEGRLINADFGGHKVQAWDAEGELLWSRPTGIEGGPVSEPLDVAAAPDGTIYVSDGAGIHLLDADRSPLTSWTPPDIVGTDTPYTIAVSDDVLYVASLVHDTIFRLTIGEQQVEVSPGPGPDVDPESSPTSEPSGLTSAAPAPTTTTFVSDPVFPVPFTLQLPPRWSQYGGSGQTSRGLIDLVLTRDSESTPAYVSVMLPINAFVDPCQTTDGPLSPPVGPTVDDLTEALTRAVGMRAGPVTDVTIDGYHGKQFLLDNNIDVTACSDNPWLHQWTYDAATSGDVRETPGEGLAGAEQRIAILDVHGTRVMVVGWTIGSRLDEVAETHEVMDSIQFP
jgi:hypothetical protein